MSEKSRIAWNNTNIRTAWEQEFYTDTNLRQPITTQVQHQQQGETTETQDTSALSGNKDVRSSSRRCSGILQCTQETSFSGFKQIDGSDSGTIRRLLWLLIMLGAGYALGIQISESVRKYVGYETNTKLKYATTKGPLDFPAVTICNTNMFRISALSEYYGGWVGVYETGLKEIRTMFPQIMTVVGSGGALPTDDSPLTHGDLFPGYQNLLEFVQNSSHFKENMISSCMFNGEICGPENFTTTLTNHGVCFTFNSIENQEKLTVTTPGQGHGLSIMLNVEESEVVAAPRENIGFKMLIHPRDEYPNVGDFGLELTPGTHTPIRLDVTEMTSLPAPYGECNSKQLKYFESYSESKCLLECETDYIVRKCGCRHFFMKVDFVSIRHTECDCPEACQETLFKSTISQSKFPSTGVGRNLPRTSDIVAEAFAEKIRESLSGQFHEFFSDMMNTLLVALNIIAGESGRYFGVDFPEQVTPVMASLEVIFGNMQYDVFNELTKHIYHELKLQSIDLGLGSEKFYELYEQMLHQYLYSGDYKKRFIAGFDHVEATTDYSRTFNFTTSASTKMHEQDNNEDNVAQIVDTSTVSHTSSGVVTTATDVDAQMTSNPIFDTSTIDQNVVLVDAEANADAEAAAENEGERPDYDYFNLLLDTYKSTSHYQSDAQMDGFVNSAYITYSFPGLFIGVFYWVYLHMYQTVFDMVDRTDQTSDVSVITTEYMSKNFAHVDIFFGDLKVEQINESPSYQLFQLICDLGGALGLFFGASLLSFIETFDFWLSRQSWWHRKNKSINQTTNQVDDLQQVVVIQQILNK